MRGNGVKNNLLCGFIIICCSALWAAHDEKELGEEEFQVVEPTGEVTYQPGLTQQAKETWQESFGYLQQETPSILQEATKTVGEAAHYVGQQASGWGNYFQHVALPALINKTQALTHRLQERWFPEETLLAPEDFEDLFPPELKEEDFEKIELEKRQPSQVVQQSVLLEQSKKILHTSEGRLPFTPEELQLIWNVLDKEFPAEKELEAFSSYEIYQGIQKFNDHLQKNKIPFNKILDSAHATIVAYARQLHESVQLGKSTEQEAQNILAYAYNYPLRLSYFLLHYYACMFTRDGLYKGNLKIGKFHVIDSIFSQEEFDLLGKIIQQFQASSDIEFLRHVKNLTVAQEITKAKMNLSIYQQWIGYYPVLSDTKSPLEHSYQVSIQKVLATFYTPRTPLEKNKKLIDMYKKKLEEFKWSIIRTSSTDQQIDKIENKHKTIYQKLTGGILNWKKDFKDFYSDMGKHYQLMYAQIQEHKKKNLPIDALVKQILRFKKFPNLKTFNNLKNSF